MNMSTVNNRTRQSTTAVAAVRTVKGGEGETVKDEEQELLVERLGGRMNIFRRNNTSHQHHHEDVTDTDITETEEHLDDATTPHDCLLQSPVSSASPQQQQQQQHDTLAADILRPAAAIKQASSYGDENEKSVLQQQQQQHTSTEQTTTTPLLPLSELIERLAQVNHDDDDEQGNSSTTSKLRQLLDRTQHGASCRHYYYHHQGSASSFPPPQQQAAAAAAFSTTATATTTTSHDNNTLLTMDEMTRILTHINLCKASSSSSNPDQRTELLPVEKKNLENCLAHVGEHGHHTHNNREMHDDQWDDASILGSFDGSVLHSFEDDGHWEEPDEAVASVPSFYYCTSANEGSRSEASLSIHKLIFQRDDDGDDDDDASGITLDALSQSCSSSVTWYEGSNYEEIEVSSDEDDPELKEILYAEALSSYAESSSSGQSSYTEEILDETDDCSAGYSSYTEVSVETSKSI